MAESMSAIILGQDSYVKAITAMKNANQAFNKDLDGLTSKLDVLNKNKNVLKIDASKAKAALKEAEKQFKATGSAADGLNLEMANANYENVSRNLKLVSKNVKQAEKDLNSLTGAASKADNTAGSAAGGAADSAAGGNLFDAFSKSGATQMLTDAALNVGTAYMTSAFGKNGGTYFSNIASSAISGASIGTAIMPGIGTAIGTIAGGVVGLVNAQTQIEGEKDEAYKSYVSDSVAAVNQAQNQTLSNGVQVYASREQMQQPFSNLLGGDQNAQQYIEKMEKFSISKSFDLSSLAEISKTLINGGYQQDELISTISNIGQAGRAHGMSTADMNAMAASLGNMNSAGTVSMENLAPLLNSNIDVWEALGRLPELAGKSSQEIQDMVSKGLIPGSEAAKAISDYMGTKFAGSMEGYSQTYQGLSDSLTEAQNQKDAAMGEGYAETREKGMREELGFLEGDGGEEMQEAYKQIGQWKASLENQKEEFNRDAMGAVMNGSAAEQFSPEAQKRLQEMYAEYQKYEGDNSDEAGAIRGRLLAEAEVIAKNEYNAGEGAQLELASQKALIENVQKDAELNDAYWDAGYTLGLKFTEGRASAMKKNNTDEYMEQYGDSDYASGIDPSENIVDLSKDPMFAKKTPVENKTLPYGNPYSSNETKSAPKAAGASAPAQGSVTPVTIMGNNFYVREEADVQKVAKEIVMQFGRAYQVTV